MMILIFVAHPEIEISFIAARVAPLIDFKKNKHYHKKKHMRHLLRKELLLFVFYLSLLILYISIRGA
jgi:hypothetical protein